VTLDPFSHEHRMRAGESIISLFDALEDTDLQAHLSDARTAVEAAAAHLKDRGFTPREAAVVLVGIVLPPVLAE
jgi:hypothetical protein